MTKKQKILLERCIQTAKEAGCPKDQVARLIGCGAVPLPWQWKFHAAARQADAKGGIVDIGVGGSRGPGKALALTTCIPTVDGWTTMGAIKIGDEIYAPDGTTTRVMGISGVQTDRKCYDVIFSDGSCITADAEHLWPTFTKKERIAFARRNDEFRRLRREKRGKIHSPIYIGLNTKERPEAFARTTEEINATLYSKNEINHSVDVSLPIQGREALLPIHPYLLGVWLGDGHKDGGKITCFDKQIIDEIRACGYGVYPLKADGLYRIDGMTSILRETRLLHNKHIPKEYLRASIEQRVALLQGLNDTDGCVDKDGSIEFTNTNRLLSEQYYELVCSLGIKATSKEGSATLYGRIISRKWRIRYTTTLQAFLLERKDILQKKNCTNITRRRFIIEIRERKSVPVQCITVDHPSHCFLVGKSFIPTHNSHAVLAQAALDDCQRVPNLKGLFLRLTGISAKESFDDLILRVVAGHVQYERTGNVLKFPNGSRIIFGGFRNENDVDKYTGIEYDFIIVEELNQITASKYVKLRGSLRTSKPNWRPRMYTSFNPGGIGHGAVRERYIIPFREGKETETKFIAATYKLNPYLNSEYTDYLEGLTDDLGKAWREGEWDIFAGQFFSEFRYDIHTVVPFAIPKHWQLYRSVDYGFRAPSSVGWYAVNEDGQAFQYRELNETGLTYKALAEKILEMTPKEEEMRIQFTVADPAIFSKSGNTGESGSEAMANAGVIVLPADNDRVAGWNRMRQYLKPFKGKRGVEESMLQIFRTCVKTIETIPQMIYDPVKQGEDALKCNIDHDSDRTRYFLQSRPELANDPTKKKDLPPATLQEKVWAELKEMREPQRVEQFDDMGLSI